MQIASLKVNHLVHAYRQAPWRIQRQWLGGFLLAVLAVAMVASLYLDITARAAISGRQIQALSDDITSVQQGNADLETRLAELNSTKAMEKRAQDLGYRPVDPNQVEYVLVPGYVEPQLDILPVAPPLVPSAPSIPPAYTESLIEWVQRELQPAPMLTMTGLSQ